MPKNGLGTMAKTTSPSPARRSRTSTVSTLPQVSELQVKAGSRCAADSKLIAEGEVSQYQFQAIFGANLKAARLKSNLKQSEVAVRTGLTQQYLSLIEAGQQNVTIRTMAILAKVVDHDLLNLLKAALGLPPKE